MMYSFERVRIMTGDILYIKLYLQANLKNLWQGVLLMRTLAAGSLLIAGVVLGFYGDSFAGIFQWEGSDGVVHFTDNPANIPSAYRKKARELDLKSDVSTPAAAIPETAPVAQKQGPGDVQPDEQLWKRRYALLRAEIKSLNDGLPARREELIEIGRKRTKFQKGSDRIAYNNLSAAITRDEERIKELEKKLEELDLEAARSAVPLEWRK
jgi:hypothetical protein